MSRIGQQPITIPSGVQVSVEDGLVTVNGPKGSLSRRLPPAIKVNIQDGQVVCERPSNSKEHRSLHGLTRTLLNNMVVGVTQGYEKRLDVIGVGYRVEKQGDGLTLQVGLSHPVVVKPYPKVEFEVGQDTNTRMPFIIVRSIDKEALGQQAAELRAVKPPSPYKKPTERLSKGIRYHGEHVRHKAGKAGKVGAK